MVFDDSFLQEVHPDWLPFLNSEIAKDYFQSLLHKLELRAKEVTIYPPRAHWFEALKFFPPADTKVLILGQDPYHGPGQAQGLSFSVPIGQSFPPSLRNILKERKSDLNQPLPFSGDLSPWAREGVLLLNSSLSVENGNAGAHLNWGWQVFTDALIGYLAQNFESIVFILWGKPAQKKEALIPSTKHLILKSAHPSPLSAYRGFFNSKPFSQANAYLREQGRSTISWELD